MLAAFQRPVWVWPLPRPEGSPEGPWVAGRGGGCGRQQRTSGDAKLGQTCHPGPSTGEGTRAAALDAAPPWSRPHPQDHRGVGLCPGSHCSGPALHRTGSETHSGKVAPAGRGRPIPAPSAVRPARRRQGRTRGGAGAGRARGGDGDGAGTAARRRRRECELGPGLGRRHGRGGPGEAAGVGRGQGHRRPDQRRRRARWAGVPAASRCRGWGAPPSRPLRSARRALGPGSRAGPASLQPRPPAPASSPGSVPRSAPARSRAYVRPATFSASAWVLAPPAPCPEGVSDSGLRGRTPARIPQGHVSGGCRSRCPQSLVLPGSEATWGPGASRELAPGCGFPGPPPAGRGRAHPRTGPPPRGPRGRLPCGSSWGRGWWGDELPGALSKAPLSLFFQGYWGGPRWWGLRVGRAGWGSGLGAWYPGTLPPGGLVLLASSISGLTCPVWHLWHRTPPTLTLRRREERIYETRSEVLGWEGAQPAPQSCTAGPGLSFRVQKMVEKMQTHPPQPASGT